MRRNNNKRNRSPRKRNSSRSVIRAIDRAETGIRFVPSSDPPEWARSPWWSITITDTLSQAKTYSYKDLNDGLLSSMGMSDAQKTAITGSFFLLRPVSIRAWGLQRQAISINIFEIVGTNGHRVKQLSDYGSGINFSRLGWRFGTAARIDPNSSESISVASVEGASTTSKVLVYWQLLFCVLKVPASDLDLGSFENLAMN